MSFSFSATSADVSRETARSNVTPVLDSPFGKQRGASEENGFCFLEIDFLDQHSSRSNARCEGGVSGYAILA